MNAVIMSLDPNEKQSVFCERKLAITCMRAVESDSVKSARKVKDKLYQACERASETRDRTLHRQKTKQNAHGKQRAR